mmetsp:Transcript_47813/g.133167  ORF Transcript_47813/g.133167 Transcript_47813/m.133167 type:complete len:368 (+) Transcript_47813:80-1183(+)
MAALVALRLLASLMCLGEAARTGHSGTARASAPTTRTRTGVLKRRFWAEPGRLPEGPRPGAAEDGAHAAAAAARDADAVVVEFRRRLGIPDPSENTVFDTPALERLAARLWVAGNADARHLDACIARLKGQLHERMADLVYLALAPPRSLGSFAMFLETLRRLRAPKQAGIDACETAEYSIAAAGEMGLLRNLIAFRSMLSSTAPAKLSHMIADELRQPRGDARHEHFAKVFIASAIAVLAASLPETWHELLRAGREHDVVLLKPGCSIERTDFCFAILDGTRRSPPDMWLRIYAVETLMTRFSRDRCGTDMKAHSDCRRIEEAMADECLSEDMDELGLAGHCPGWLAKLPHAADTGFHDVFNVAPP